MFVRDYTYKYATVDCGDHIEIEGVKRDSYISDEFAHSITLDRPTAILYSGGFNIHQSESRDLTGTKDRARGSVDYNPSTLVIKESTVYAMHKWIGSMENNHFVKYANINSNTCASSMFSLYEAERLLDGTVDEVIIIAEERTSFNTIRIFKEHGIDVKPADGFVVVRLTNDATGIKITDTKWEYEYNRNPFGATQSGYSKVDSECKVIKPHGTMTPNNDNAEKVLLEGREVVNLKKNIGHSQGVSALLEVCMMIDSEYNNILCVASGLGGFYGSCMVHKH